MKYTQSILTVTSIIILIAQCTPPQEVSFNQDIAPIIFENCSPCHRDEGIAPMSFNNYEQVLEYADMIVDVTQSRFMPPWNADPHYTSFLQERYLTDQQLKAIKNWVKQGAREGESDLCCSVTDYGKDHGLGEPDTIICMAEPYLINGDGKDNYRTFVLPLKMPADRFLKAVDLVSTAPKLIHHAFVSLDTSGMFLQMDQMDEEQGINSFNSMKGRLVSMLHGYLPGFSSLMQFPKGIGKKIYAKSYLILNVHYSPTSKDEWDQSCVHLYFSDNMSQRQILGHVIKEKSIVDGEFIIPANKVSHFHLEKTIEQDISLISLYPHMHFRGKTFKAYAITSDQTKIPLIKIDNWDFNWQSAHTFPKLIKIPANSVVHIEASFDNRADNPFNPILPPIDVGRGSSSYDEMLFLGMEYLKYQQGDETIKYAD